MTLEAPLQLAQKSALQQVTAFTTLQSCQHTHTGLVFNPSRPWAGKHGSEFLTQAWCCGSDHGTRSDPPVPVLGSRLTAERPPVRAAG